MGFRKYDYDKGKEKVSHDEEQALLSDDEKLSDDENDHDFRMAVIESQRSQTEVSLSKSSRGESSQAKQDAFPLEVLHDLYPELLTLIVSRLSNSDLARLALTSKKFHQFVEGIETSIRVRAKNSKDKKECIQGTYKEIREILNQSQFHLKKDEEIQTVKDTFSYRTFNTANGYHTLAKAEKICIAGTTFLFANLGGSAMALYLLSNASTINSTVLGCAVIFYGVGAFSGTFASFGMFATICPNTNFFYNCFRERNRSKIYELDAEKKSTLEQSIISVLEVDPNNVDKELTYSAVSLDGDNTSRMTVDSDDPDIELGLNDSTFFPNDDDDDYDLEAQSSSLRMSR